MAVSAGSQSWPRKVSCCLNFWSVWDTGPSGDVAACCPDSSSQCLPLVMCLAGVHPGSRCPQQEVRWRACSWSALSMLPFLLNVGWAGSCQRKSCARAYSRSPHRGSGLGMGDSSRGFLLMVLEITAGLVVAILQCFWESLSRPKWLSVKWIVWRSPGQWASRSWAGHRLVAVCSDRHIPPQVQYCSLMSSPGADLLPSCRKSFSLACRPQALPGASAPGRGWLMWAVLGRARQTGSGATPAAGARMEGKRAGTPGMDGVSIQGEQVSVCMTQVLLNHTFGIWGRGGNVNQNCALSSELLSKCCWKWLGLWWGTSSQKKSPPVCHLPHPVPRHMENV